MSTSTGELHRAGDLVFDDLGGGVHRHAWQGDGLGQVRLRLDAGAVLATHTHPEEQYTLVLSGSVRYRMAVGRDDEYAVELHAGDGIRVPSMLPHEAHALTAARTVETFVPGLPTPTPVPAPVVTTAPGTTTP